MTLPNFGTQQSTRGAPPPLIVRKQAAYVQMSREMLIDLGLIEPTWAERERDAIAARRLGFRFWVWRRHHRLPLRRAIAHRIYDWEDDD